MRNSSRINRKTTGLERPWQLSISDENDILIGSTEIFTDSREHKQKYKKHNQWPLFTIFQIQIMMTGSIESPALPVHLSYDLKMQIQ